MDVSDVLRKNMLMNGKPSTDLQPLTERNCTAGDRKCLRISNGGASSYFWLTYGAVKLIVVANDGNDVDSLKQID